jgi:hypothetical protein
MYFADIPASDYSIVLVGRPDVSGGARLSIAEDAGGGNGSAAYSTSMATAPVQLDEESLIRSFVDQIDLPPGVEFRGVDQATDLDGEPLLRIYFAVDVSREYPVTPKRIKALTSKRHKLQDRIFASQIEKWPLFSFLEVK